MTTSWPARFSIARLVATLIWPAVRSIGLVTPEVITTRFVPLPGCVAWVIADRSEPVGPLPGPSRELKTKNVASAIRSSNTSIDGLEARARFRLGVAGAPRPASALDPFPFPRFHPQVLVASELIGAVPRNPVLGEWFRGV